MLSNAISNSEINSTKLADVGGGKKTLTRSDFLKLLTTQLKYQDPLKPMDNTEFTAQTAQFSSLDELFTINDQLKSMAGYQANQNSLAALNYLGKEVTAKGGKVEVKDGQQSLIYFDLTKQASEVGVNIYDAEGRLVSTIHEAGKEQGMHNVSWNGKGNNGEKLSDGVYQFEVFAKDLEGEKIDVTGRIHGIVNGLRYKDGEPYIAVGSIEVPASEVTEIKQTKEGLI